MKSQSIYKHVFNERQKENIISLRDTKPGRCDMDGMNFFTSLRNFPFSFLPSLAHTSYLSFCFSHTRVDSASNLLIARKGEEFEKFHLCVNSSFIEEKFQPLWRLFLLSFLMHYLHSISDSFFSDRWCLLYALPFTFEMRWWYCIEGICYKVSHMRIQSLVCVFLKETLFTLALLEEGRCEYLEEWKWLDVVVVQLLLPSE